MTLSTSRNGFNPSFYSPLNMSCWLNAITASMEITAAILSVNPQAQATEIVYAVVYASCEYEIEPALLYAIANVESHFHHGNRRAIGDDGHSQGLMQVYYAFWRGTLPPFLYKNRSIWGNVNAAAWILKYWKERYKGQGRWWRRYNGFTPAKTAPWERKVLRAWGKWREELNYRFSFS